MHTSLNRIVLSFPSLLSLADADKSARRSWIQLARTGSFTSSRYGKFSITKDDLSSMLHNFKNITPKEPTELPVDWDHLSMDPKKPGDGAAAGWFKDLELRGDGEELWGEVEWTPKAAESIRNREYKFVSPSFVKDHTHKDGTKIGTTLLAAAITNHPFLENMAALTLYNARTMGDLALADGPAERMAKAVGGPVGTTPGQRVMIAPGHARTQDELGAKFEIAEVVGRGDDAFVSVKDAGPRPQVVPGDGTASGQRDPGAPAAARARAGGGAHRAGASRRYRRPRPAQGSATRHAEDRGAGAHDEGQHREVAETGRNLRERARLHARCRGRQDQH
jgi:hypothetical protein